jgi:NAD(P)H dehydrogenase (quinone)
MKNVLVVVGHPNPNSFIAALARAYASRIEASGPDVSVETLVLSDLKFDPVLRHGYRADQPLEPDLVRAKEAIERAQHVAWFFPMWWAAPPAVVKGFVDRTFLPGWAFGYGGKAISDKLLRGRSARFVTTMDSPSLWYRFIIGRALHGSFVSGTLAFVGFAPIRETTFYGVREMSERKRAKALERVAREGASDVRSIPAREPVPALASV